MKNVLKIIGNIISVLIIAFLVIFKILQMTNVIYVLEVKTGSMESEINSGDYIIITKNDDYKVGDIITYSYEDLYVTHRIIDIKGNKYITKGDANNTEDDPVNKSDVLGKYIYKNKVLNIVIRYRIIFAMIAIILFIISVLIGNDKKKYDNKEITEE